MKTKLLRKLRNKAKKEYFLVRYNDGYVLYTPTIDGDRRYLRGYGKNEFPLATKEWDSKRLDFILGKVNLLRKKKIIY